MTKAEANVTTPKQINNELPTIYRLQNGEWNLVLMRELMEGDTFIIDHRPDHVCVAITQPSTGVHRYDETGTWGINAEITPIDWPNQDKCPPPPWR